MSLKLLKEYVRDSVLIIESESGEDTNSEAEESEVLDPFKGITGSFSSMEEFTNSVNDSLKKFKKSKLSKIKDKKGLAAAGSVANLGLDILVPYYSAVSNATDLIRKTYAMKDNKKSNTFLDNFNIDDNLSKIVDDELEKDFLEWLLSKDDVSLENMNINALLQDYLANEFEKRTVDIKK